MTKRPYDYYIKDREAVITFEGDRLYAFMGWMLCPPNNVDEMMKGVVAAMNKAYTAGYATGYGHCWSETEAQLREAKLIS